MTLYEIQANAELETWKRAMRSDPSFSSMLAKRLQNRINSVIPEKIHQAITGAIKQMTRAVLFGAGFTTAAPALPVPLEVCESRVMERIIFYRNTATAEGAITG